jgi:hypothetical protein
LELQKNVRGREISDEQRDKIVSALKGTPLPDLVTYVVRDPEAEMYAFSIIDVLQELGMAGKISILEGQAPKQTGVMFCGDGSEDSVRISRVLMDAKVVGISAPGTGVFGHDKDGKEIRLPYCPPRSIFVGLRPPLSQIRSHRLEEMLKQQQTSKKPDP